MNPAGEKRFKSSVSMPVDLAEKVAGALGKVITK
jgi:hypothetical protein